MPEKIEVLDHGYVRLVDVMGTDLSVVNAARVSYDKESGLAINGEMYHKDKRLLKFLAEHKHHSPYRHATLTFEVYAPLMVARQWWKHVVASAHLEESTAWNESSRRYVTEEPEFYIPDETQWRSAPENKKQGSGDPIDAETGLALESSLIWLQRKALEGYEYALSLGVCPEQARLFLPAYALYVRWRWTASLQSVIHFIDLREGHDAQAEIQQYAQAVKQLVEPLFPESLAAFDKTRIAEELANEIISTVNYEGVCTPEDREKVVALIREAL